MRAELYNISVSGPGRLAIAPRPRGGDWLEDEISALAREGVQVVVSALTAEEITELDLADEGKLCETQGIEYVAFPIQDRGVPSSPVRTAALVRRLEAKLVEGKMVAIHCRQGVGRSALVAACLLVALGLNPDTAFERIRVARGCEVPDTDEQREWVRRFARELVATASQTSGSITE
jgi:protein-tyrosine phosphatase